MPARQITVSKRQGRLGVTCINGTPTGARVSKLVEGSIAAAAGLHVGDVISAINGHLVHSHTDATSLIDRADDIVAFVTSAPTRRVVLNKAHGRIGITCSASEDSGVLVSGLERGSLASREGVLVGDTLLAVNDTLVYSHDEAIRLVDSQQVVSMVLAADTREVRLDKSTGRKVGVTIANNLPGGSGVVVIGIDSGSTLAITQLQIGETILSVDGQLVKDHASAIALIDANKATVRLVVGPHVRDLSAVLSAVTGSATSSSRGAEDAGPRYVAHQMCGPPAQNGI